MGKLSLGTKVILVARLGQHHDQEDKAFKVSLTSKVDLIKELGRVDLISKEDLDT